MKDQRNCDANNTHLYLLSSSFTIDPKALRGLGTDCSRGISRFRQDMFPTLVEISIQDDVAFRKWLGEEDAIFVVIEVGFAGIGAGGCVAGVERSRFSIAC